MWSCSCKCCFPRNCRSRPQRWVLKRAIHLMILKVTHKIQAYQQPKSAGERHFAMTDSVSFNSRFHQQAQSSINDRLAVHCPKHHSFKTSKPHVLLIREIWNQKTSVRTTTNPLAAVLDLPFVFYQPALQPDEIWAVYSSSCQNVDTAMNIWGNEFHLHP